MKNDTKNSFDSPVYRQIKKEKEKTLAQRAASVPKTPADRLSSAFGVFGLILYYLLFLMIAYAPLLFLGFPWWANILIVLGIWLIPYAGGLMEFILWVWSFLLVIKLPLGFTVVLYYIGAVLYVLFVLLPSLLSHFGIE